MNVLRVIDRLDDWINPVVVKELRQAVKSRLVVALLVLFLGLQVLVLGAFLTNNTLRAATPGNDPIDWSAGRQLFEVLQGILLGTCMFLIPAYTAFRMAADRSETNVDLLFITTLKPRAIIAGKYFAAVVLALLIYSACAPFMTFTYLLRGIDLPTILLILGLDLLAMLFSVQVALFLATVPGPRVVKGLLGLGGFVLLATVFRVWLEGSIDLLRYGSSIDEDPAVFWAPVAVTAGLVASLVGTMFFWSVALISPPSSNRALAGRIFLVVQCLLLGTLCVSLELNLKLPVRNSLVTVWVVYSVLAFCVQLAISVNERDHWGPRVARSVPRSVLLRPVAFLFYSGSAGGVLLSVLGVAATLLAFLAWKAEPTLGPGRDPDLERSFWFCLSVALYTYCYCLSAALVRSYLLRHQVREHFTWLVALLLIGLACSMPLLVVFLVHFNDRHYHVSDESWLFLPNPLVQVRAVLGNYRGGSRDGYIENTFMFLSIWALLVSVPGLYWAGSQYLRFRRPSPPRGKAAPAPAEAPAPVPPVPAGAEAG